MKRFVKGIALVSAVVGIMLPAPGHAGPVLVARDNASNYTNWDGSGLNEGVGFDPWVFRTSGGGTYLASTEDNSPNPRGDLNYIWSVPGYHAWGTWADDGAGQGEQYVAAYRGFGWNGSFWGTRLARAGDMLKISFENAILQTVDTSSGFAIRNGNSTNSPANFDTNARFQFGIYSAAPLVDLNYSIFDASGKRDTGISSRDSGLNLEFTLTAADTYSFAIYNATNSGGPPLTNIVGTLSGSGTLDSISLFNRDTDTGGNFFFNKMEIWHSIPPTLFIVR